MNADQKAMLRKLSAMQFAASELRMFLDTHPDNKEAFEMYNDYRSKAEKLLKEYESKYGPLVTGDFYGNTGWDWLNGPWPWESDKEMSN